MERGTRGDLRTIGHNARTFDTFTAAQRATYA
jgi:hypothetical protein